MKYFKILSAIPFAAIMLLSSCGNNDEQKTETVSTDSTVAKTEAPAKPQDVMIVMHKVANFDKWMAAYTSGDSMRLAAGLHDYIIGRGIEDNNSLLVAVRMDDAAKAKDFMVTPALKEAMQKGGVIGVPSITRLNVQMMDSTTNTATSRVIITHKVKDWDAWKKSFDSHKQTRVDAGLSDRAIGYDVDDNHMVTVVLAINDMTKAKAFMASQDLKDKMKEAGVEGEPKVFMYNVVKAY